MNNSEVREQNVNTKLSEIMDFPKLQKGQFAVMKAQVHPGLFLGLGPHLDFDHGRWRIFNTLAAANRYAAAQIAAQPSFECGIYNAAEVQVQQLRA